jgi:hypothetical protein
VWAGALGLIPRKFYKKDAAGLEIPGQRLEIEWRFS